MIQRFVVNYIQRHQNRLNQLLHLVGVPLTFVVSVIFAVRGEWLWAAGAFVGGYVLQFIGHAIEGNDAGEVVLVKRWLGLPYQEFAPGRSPPKPAVSATSEPPADNRSNSSG